MDKTVQLLTPEDIAGFLNVTTRTVTTLITRGELPGIKVGRQWRVYPDQLNVYIHNAGTPTYRDYVERMKSGNYDFSQNAGEANHVENVE